MKLEWVVVGLVVIWACARVSRTEALVGDWRPIKNIDDPHVTETANFAVTDYNKRSGARLALVKVISGETQIVAGTNYRLFLSANNGSVANNYVAVVWEKPWLHFRNLTSFYALHD